MLNAVRRGPASIAKKLLSPSTSRICITSNTPRIICPKAPRLQSCTTLRALCTTSQWRQRAAVKEQEEEIEDEIVDEPKSQRSPSDAQIHDATRYGPVTRFDELSERGMVCNTVVKTITQGMGLETMTEVQSLTINETLKGIDVLAQARTGTGKTLAFLIPVLQNIITKDPSLERRSGSHRSRGSPMDIRAIIISPTRELAEQIAVEAKKVTRNTGVIVQTAVGGSRKQEGLRKIKNEGCHILVGTPGRLNDILEDPYSQVRAPNLSAFVLDEADRLLDQGFAPEIQAIQRLLPDRSTVDRQTLLFSATIPQELMQIVRHTMKPDFKFVRTVQEGAQETHEKVPQKVVNVGGFENVIPAVLELCKREIQNNQSFKAIIYFNATADVTLASQIFANLRNPGQSLFHQHPLHPVKQFYIHAKLSQQGRTRAAESFRRADSAILFSSDVTARGMDFPNVTHVIQVGVPSSRDTYIHRIGRTARGDKGGEGWIFLTDLEVQENSFRLRKLPLNHDTSLETAKVDMTRDAQLPEDTAKILTQVVDAAKMAPRGDKVASYLAALGIYGWVADKQQLINAMNNRAKYLWAMDPPPSVGRGLVQKLGLLRLRGVNIGHEQLDDSESPSRGSYGNSSGGYAVGGGRGSRSSYGSSDRGGGFGASRSSYGGSNRGDSYAGSRGSGSSRGDGGFRRTNDRNDSRRSDYTGYSREGRGGGSDRSFGSSRDGGRGRPSYER